MCKTFGNNIAVPSFIRENMAETSSKVSSKGMRTVKVWDLAVRIFHWLLVLLIVASWATAKAKGNWMTWHMYSGYTILVLVLFRIAWGVIGSTHARFSSFIYGPSRVIAYVFRQPPLKSVAYLGHNALGGWMIVVLLVCLLVQVGTGLCANDDIVTDRPLVKWISKDLSDRMTGLHHVGFNVLLALLALHICGALFYLFFRKDNLIVPMFTGVKNVPEHDADRAQLTPRMLDRRRTPRGADRRRPGRPDEVRIVNAWVAVLLLALAAGFVYLLVTIKPG